MIVPRTTKTSSQASFLLLPLEIRSEIYKLLELSGPITIGSEDCGDKDFQSCIPGLPPNHIPVVRASFDKELLQPPHVNNHEPSDSDTDSEYTTPTLADLTDVSEPSLFVLLNESSPSIDLVDTICSFRLTCRQIASELAIPGSPSSLSNKNKTNLDLYLSFPFGVCVVVHKHYGILRQARNIKIAGAHYFQRSEMDMMKPHRKSHSWTDLERLDDGTETPNATTLDSSAQLVAAQNKALQTLVWALLGHTKADAAEQMDSSATTSNLAPLIQPLTRSMARHTPHRPSHLDKLHVRIFFPNQQPSSLQPSSYDTYRAIWELQESPVPLVLGAICGGDIVLSCARGRQAVGVEIVARDNGGKARCVTGVWPSLDGSARQSEGERGSCWWTEELEVGEEGVNFAKLKGADEIGV